MGHHQGTLNTDYSALLARGNGRPLSPPECPPKSPLRDPLPRRRTPPLPCSSLTATLSLFARSLSDLALVSLTPVIFFPSPTINPVYCFCNSASRLFSRLFCSSSSCLNIGVHGKYCCLLLPPSHQNPLGPPFLPATARASAQKAPVCATCIPVPPLWPGPSASSTWLTTRKKKRPGPLRCLCWWCGRYSLSPSAFQPSRLALLNGPSACPFQTRIHMHSIHTINNFATRLASLVIADHFFAFLVQLRASLCLASKLHSAAISLPHCLASPRPPPTCQHFPRQDGFCCPFRL